MLSSFCLTAFAVFQALSVRAQYSLLREYSGSSFFDRWQYFDHFDNLTNGDVIFVSQSVAQSSQLTFLNSAGNAVIKVDNASTVPFNQKRNTVRITTTDSYGLGTLWVADMLHVPFGCSVWPAWWSQAPKWPEGGEIDTLESVNLATHNQIALHTDSGCSLDTSSAQLSGQVNSTNCAFDVNNNQGCIVTDPSTASYGEAFAAAGGGVFVTELAEKGISIWFFSRSSVPSALQNNPNKIDTSSLGTPIANYPSSGCSMDKFFEPQNLILDITLCGDFAGNAGIFAQTCPGTCYPDYVVGNGSNYADAYFEIKSIRTFSNGSSSSGGNGSSSGGHNAAVTTSPAWPTFITVFALVGSAIAVLF